MIKIYIKERIDISTLVTLLIGIFILVIGYLVLTKKALFLINLVLWNGLSGDEDLLSRIFGISLLVIGGVIIILPFIL